MNLLLLRAPRFYSCLNRLDLIIELLIGDSGLQKLLAVPDPPQHLAAIIVELCVESANIVVNCLLVLVELFFKLCKLASCVFHNARFTFYHVMMKLIFLDILYLFSFEFGQALLRLNFKFFVLEGIRRSDFHLLNQFLNRVLQVLAILRFKLFVEKGLIVELEGLRPLTECLWKAPCNHGEVLAEEAIGGSQGHLLLDQADLSALTSHNAPHLSEMVLEVVEVDVELEKGVRWYDCFYIRDIAGSILFEFALCQDLSLLFKFTLGFPIGLTLA